MDKKAEIIKTVKELLGVYCCPELKAAAEEYLSSADTPEEPQAAEKLRAVLPESIASIDDAIAFAASDYAVSKFGAEGAAEILRSTQAAKAAGEKYCGCDGCRTALELMRLLG